MIDAYVWTTPNGEKPLIALAELGIPYTAHWINIGKGEQDTAEFRRINPNGKIPALVDSSSGDATGTMAVFESLAVLVYLADKTGKLMPKAGPERYVVLEWMAFNVGGTGPMTGQLAHFAKYAKEKLPYAIDRYTKEVGRLHDVLDRRLGETKFLGGDEYSMADVMNFSWAKGAVDNFGLSTDTRPNLKRWLDEVGARPAVVKARSLKPA